MDPMTALILEAPEAPEAPEGQIDPILKPLIENGMRFQNQFKF
jgi:hypothetical protein